MFVIIYLNEWAGGIDHKVVGICESEEQAEKELDHLLEEAIVLMEKVEGIDKEEVAESATIEKWKLMRRVYIDACITLKAEEATVGKMSKLSF